MNPPEKPSGLDSWKTIAGPLTQVTAAFDPPRHIGRYRVETLLGEGGFGCVYLAHDDQLVRRVAIKVPRRERLSLPHDAEAYLSEARILASLDHPHIVPVYDAGTTEDGLCYVVSQWIDGNDLAWTMRNRRVPPEQAAALMAAVAEALHHAHSRGLVHRDIKPANILLDKTGKPYVADFDLALKEENIGKGACFAGTPAYMSPEQARGEGHRVEGRSDLFSVGVVFYELLTGRRPFQGGTLPELLEQITRMEARPLRQLQDSVPRELERICLKALSKRISERHMTGKDLADDLRDFLARPPQEAPRPLPVERPFAARVPSTLANAPPGTPSTDPRPGHVIPKGLRAFDAQDADFILELLPGARDREGLPESIRFWKKSIEENDRDKTFAVGLIYGPSGCGKSSLVKAGLLPRLASDVHVVYVEATAADTETRLLSGLRKIVARGSVADQGLQAIMTALRRGEVTLSESALGVKPDQAAGGQPLAPRGKKVLIVLDQFEQWLHGRNVENDTELVQALRQCDGGRVQCLVMIRDDFWLAVTRFARALEIGFLEGKNSAVVDLFDRDHARKVLAALGRAHGRLAMVPNEITQEQTEFLRLAVSALAEDAKVNCVHLALFAEMMKGKPWTPASFRELGGAQGIGLAFLEDTFNSATAPPERRFHQPAARAILKALLPEAGADIMGHMRTSQELLEASGYAGRPRDFEDLIGILDREMRLITPTDPEGQAGALVHGTQGSSAPSGISYYQLAHDYLVASLRTWLTAKEKETRRGRAELLLQDLASAWHARPEASRLPSLRQWGNIRMLTRKKTWTAPQRKMMRQAARLHGLRAMVIAICLGLVAWGAYESHGLLQAHNLRDRLMGANTTDVPAIVQEMGPYRPWLGPLLHAAYHEAETNRKVRQQLHAALALLPMEPGHQEYLYGRLLAALPHEVAILQAALAPHKQELLDKLWTDATHPPKGQEQQRLRAACALAAYEPESPRWANVHHQVAHDLVAVPAVYLGTWMNALRPVRLQLLAPLTVIFGDTRRLETERSLATAILADFAADQPHVLANLLMDADEKQYAVLFPVATDLAYGNTQQHKIWPQVAALLTSEIASQLSGGKRTLLKSPGSILADAGIVKVLDGRQLPAAVFEVRLRAGNTYCMAMESMELESFLVVHDKSGREVASDDYGGGDPTTTMLVYSPDRDDTYKVYAASSKGKGSFVLTIEETVADAVKEKLAKRQANAAVALMRRNDPAAVWPLLKHSPDPRVRSYLIHRFGPLGADPADLIRRAQEELDVTVQRALILSLGEFPDQAWQLGDRDRALRMLKEAYQTVADAGLQAASEWVLRRWGEQDWLKRVDDRWKHDEPQRQLRLEGIKRDLANRATLGPWPIQWYINAHGQKMVVIPAPGEFRMGTPPTEEGRYDYEHLHTKRIGRSFAIAAREVTVDQFQQFHVDAFKEKYTNFNKKYSPTGDSPVSGVSWYQAAAYCNWLSKQHGIPENQRCYEPNKQGAYADGMRCAMGYLSRTGYRLPTESEWEYACRARASTSRYYGETDVLLGNYAWYTKNSLDRGMLPGVPGRLGVRANTLKPNDFGLFDMLGNASEWCQNVLVKYQDGHDIEEELVISPDHARSLRGGSFRDQAIIVRCAERGTSYAPSHQGGAVGFRLARTIAAE